jgi:hypothetical protein
MKFRLNDLVNTPIGQGLFQGRFGVLERGTTVEKEEVALVRLNVNAETEPHLKDPNCVTPHAEGCGLWTFGVSELS